MTDAPSTSRPRLLRIIAGVSLCLVSALVVVDHARLSRLIEDNPAGTQEAQIGRLQSQLAELQTVLSSIRGEPRPVSELAYAATEKAESSRLEVIEQSLANVARPADLGPIADRLTRLEGEVWRLRHPKPTPLRRVTRAPIESRPVALRPAQLSTPFTILGMEMRGGEPFLTVAPVDAHALAQVRVLHPGDTEGNWRLEALDGRTAVFEVAGRLQRIPIP